MSSLVEVLGTFAPGHTIAYAGREFTFRRIDQRMKAALTVSYFRRAREAVYAIRGEVEPDEYDRQLKAVLDAYRRGEYAFPGLEVLGYYMRPAGMVELTSQLTGCTETEAYGLLEAMEAEVLHVCLCVMYESMGLEEKKKLRSLEATAPMRFLVELLSQTKSTNGSRCSTPTAPRASPAQASPCGTSPASPTAPST